MNSTTSKPLPSALLCMLMAAVVAACGGAEDSNSGPIASVPSPAPAGPAPGSTDVWTRLSLPGWQSGDMCQSIVVDPVNPGTLVTACGNNDGRKIKWYRTTDYGNNWTLANDTAMNGDPWGFSIDPNPTRDPATKPAIYSPAGYGSLGIWKSTDLGSSWTRLTAADTAYAPYNPFGVTDLYHTAVLPDDPPNHLLVTYHYGFKGSAANEGGFGESWDAGNSWVIHMPPAGVGSSHYVLPVSATTWCVISQETDRGVWRTTTAGRINGTAAQKYRDGTVSTSAWQQVSTHAHAHGSYTPVKLGTAWYSPGYGDGGGSVWKSTDGCETWTNLVPGYYWPSPPNSAFMNKNVTGLAATAKYIYSNAVAGETELARAPRNAETQWVRNYTTTPADLQGNAANPFGTLATQHQPSGYWMVYMATNNGVWRYIEP